MMISVSSPRLAERRTTWPLEWTNTRKAARAPSSRRGGDALGELVATLFADEAFASSGEPPSGPSTRAAWCAAVARLGLALPPPPPESAANGDQLRSLVRASLAGDALDRLF